MKKMNFLRILTLLLFPLLTLSQTTDNVELKKMYNEDQHSRQVANINWEELSKADRIREQRVYELIEAGQIKTGQDYYYSAMIFQHGSDSKAYGMAVKQMRKAIELDSTINRWLLAAAIDRELMSKDRPQIYGTQYTKKDQSSKWELYTIDTTKVTDAERKYYHVESLAEQRIKVRRMNLLPISAFYSKSNSLEKTIELIMVENKKGVNSSYNVGEDGINRFAYELLSSKKMNEALAIFTLNTELYPNGYNAFDSLGECLLILNRKDEGIKAYKRSLELNPKNESARKVLNDLK